MTMLAILDDGPVLLRYWEPADGSALTDDLGEAVRIYLHEKPHLKVIVNTRVREDEYRVIAIDTTRSKIRDWRMGLRETRL